MSKRAQERRTGEEPRGGEIEATEFDVKKFERESISHVEFGYIIQPGELQSVLEFWSHKHWETRARQKRKLSVKFSRVAQRWQSFVQVSEMIGTRDESAFRHQENRAWSTESNYRGEVEQPKSRNLQYSIHWESLRECSTKVESSRRRPDSAGPKKSMYWYGDYSCQQQRKQRYIFGENYKDNLFTCRNTNFEALKTLFDITQKLILNQRHEIRHVSTIEWQFNPWISSTLQHVKVIKLSKAKVHLYSDSVLCFGKMHRHPKAKDKLEDHLFDISRYPMNAENCFESTENHVSVSGIFPRTHNSGNSLRESDENDKSQYKTWKF